MRRLFIVCIAALIALLIGACGGSSRHSDPHAVASMGTTSTAPAPLHSHKPKHRHHSRPAPVKKASHPRHVAKPAHRPAKRHHTSPSPSGGTGTGTTTTVPVTSHKSHHRHHRRKSRNPPKPQAERTSLDLSGGSSTTAVACGLKHHQRVYPSGSSIKFSGAVKPIPNTQWKVKIKIKVCQNGTYVDYSKFQVPVNKRRGTFKGTFPAPPAGHYYEVTSRLYVTDVEVAKSLEIHFQIP